MQKNGYLHFIKLQLSHLSKHINSSFPFFSADFILGGMNRSVNPCDDFYEYACGKWSEKNAIPKGLRKWNIWFKLQVKTLLQVQGNQPIYTLLFVKFKIGDSFSVY